jgi:phosphoserine phosphatase
MRPLLVLLMMIVSAVTAAAATELPSWNDGPVRTAILEYLADVTDPGHADFIPVAERIAVLDNDGTFWCERPDYASTMFQRSLLMSRIDQGLADIDQPPFRAWYEYDRGALRDFGWGEAYRRMNMAFAGMPVAAYRDSAASWLDRHPHSDFKVRHTELYYVPMLELARLLEAREFQVWVVTGAAQDFVRSYIEQAAGIPPERVIGSWTPARSVIEGNTITVVRDSIQVGNGYEKKPANIETRIGRRPVFAAGNSNNDHPMCLYSITGQRRGLAIWIHHDDRKREYDYDRGTDRMQKLVKELDGAHEVSIRRDWSRVFREGVER